MRSATGEESRAYTHRGTYDPIVETASGMIAIEYDAVDMMLAAASVTC
jgi:hypothetical protein